ncbi:hypothetical protein [uncultured Sphingomonas sp.]|uniref:hypothetical protein n=1 Tax=uncultured Sphingomonas sp. TaxID=158754 RepID=UPI0035C97481
MRMLALSLIATAGLAGCAQTPAQTARAQAAAAASQQALAGELTGLRAVSTSDCLQDRSATSGLKAYGDSLVYRVSDRLKYVNATTGGCEGVARGDVLVTISNSGRLCRGDIARTVDQTGHFPTGSCALGSFTTYRK